ncbi:hypothetical protein BH09BAC2_BH09BAC2_13940 [soil metagenome]
MKNFLLAAVLITAVSCTNNDGKNTTGKNGSKKQTTENTEAVNDSLVEKPDADAATILAKKQVPILCYHHIKNGVNGEYSVTPEKFAEQMKLLADSGYKTVLPDDIYNYLMKGGSVPEKCVMISFDDTDLEQFTIGKTEMDKYGFKGVYFIMTIAMNRPRYMSKEQIKQLSDEGHVIACHTWDHHMVTKYTPEDWEIQLDKPKQKLEEIIGKNIRYFAYPFGLWNTTAIPELQKRDIKMGFQLATKRDSTLPQYTVRRIIVAGQWSAGGMLQAMKSSFK